MASSHVFPALCITAVSELKLDIPQVSSTEVLEEGPNLEGMLKSHICADRYIPGAMFHPGEGLCPFVWLFLYAASFILCTSMHQFSFSTCNVRVLQNPRV